MTALERAAKALYLKDFDCAATNRELPDDIWDRLGVHARRTWTKRARAAIRAYLEGAPRVEIRRGKRGLCGHAETSPACDLYHSDEFEGNCNLHLGAARAEGDWVVVPGPGCPGQGTYVLAEEAPE